MSVITPPGVTTCVSTSNIKISTTSLTRITWNNCRPDSLEKLSDFSIRLEIDLMTSEPTLYIQDVLFYTQGPGVSGYYSKQPFAIISIKSNEIVLFNAVQNVTYTINYQPISDGYIPNEAYVTVTAEIKERNELVFEQGAVGPVIEPTQSFGLNSTITIQSNSLKFNAKQTDMDDLIRVPAITIALQSDIYGNNLDEVAFNIYDTIAYCSNYPEGCNNNNNGRCVNTVANKRTRICPIVNVPSDALIKTEYLKRLYNFNKVVRGKGCTLRQKLESINDTGLNTDEFMLRVCLFGMIKYILARMMTGEFRLRWLLNRNEREFFQRLNRSRLCEFREAFELPEIRGYDKYFR